MHDLTRRIHDNVARVLLGKDPAIQLAIATLLAGGHLLIEDRPGVGKTLLARALARSLDLPFQRLQCTADLLPSDVVGCQVYQPGSGEITFRPGPVFTSVLVADELNRTPPRTQSALLECMQERRVTIERTTHALPDPFFVVATQNPLAYTGTYPLPENQLDRFLMRIRIGYPDTATEIAIVQKDDGHRGIDQLQAVARPDEVLAARQAVDRVKVQADVAAYMVALATATRSAHDVKLGVSTRGVQALHRASRARALMLGRDFVVPDDVRTLLVPVFAHRMSVRGSDGAAEAILMEMLSTVATPD